MITAQQLDALKVLYSRAAPGPIAVSRMNQAGTHFQLHTPKKAGGILVGNFFREGNAEYARAAWEWLPKLIEELEATPRLVATRAPTPVLSPAERVMNIIGEQGTTQNPPTTFQGAKIDWDAPDAPGAELVRRAPSMQRRRRGRAPRGREGMGLE